VYLLVLALVNWLKNPTSTDIDILKKAHQYSIEVGDIAYAGFASYFVVSRIFGHRPLEDCYKDGRDFIEFLRHCTQSFLALS
jgi:hypothetical protein